MKELKASELRIGNLFQEKHTKEIISVYELLADRIVFTGSFEKGWQAEPIELTEEWLLKFGFEKEIIDCNHIRRIYYYIDDFEVEFHGKKLVFRVETENSTRYFAHKTRHIHQLQNLYFSLCGEELTIKN